MEPDMRISRPMPIPSTPLIRRAAALQAAIRRPDCRGLILPALLIGVWSLATAFGWVDTRILVSPLETLKTGWHLVIGKMLWDSLGYSLARDAAGFLAGSLIGLLLGTLLG